MTKSIKMSPANTETAPPTDFNKLCEQLEAQEIEVSIVLNIEICHVCICYPFNKRSIELVTDMACWLGR